MDKSIETESCIMPEMPYCPACQYGYVSFYNDDFEGIENIQFTKWCCCLREK
jgi:hypothetical protein